MLECNSSESKDFLTPLSKQLGDFYHCTYLSFIIFNFFSDFLFCIVVELINSYLGFNFLLQLFSLFFTA